MNEIEDWLRREEEWIRRGGPSTFAEFEAGEAEMELDASPGSLISFPAGYMFAPASLGSFFADAVHETERSRRLLTDSTGAR